MQDAQSTSFSKSLTIKKKNEKNKFSVLILLFAIYLSVQGVSQYVSTASTNFLKLGMHIQFYSHRSLSFLRLPPPTQKIGRRRQKCEETTFLKIPKIYIGYRKLKRIFGIQFLKLKCFEFPQPKKWIKVFYKINKIHVEYKLK